MRYTNTRVLNFTLGSNGNSIFKLNEFTAGAAGRVLV